MTRGTEAGGRYRRGAERAARAALMAAIAVAFSMGRPGAARAQAAEVAAGAPASAPRVTIPDQPAALDVGEAWKQIPAPAVVDGPAVVLRHDGGAVLAVTVSMSPNADAWRDKKRKAYVAEVVAGFEATEGVRVGEPVVHKVRGVPCVDLWVERDAGDKVRGTAVRLLLFRTRTIAAAAEGAPRKTLEAAVQALVPTIEVD